MDAKINAKLNWTKRQVIGVGSYQTVCLRNVLLSVVGVNYLCAE